MGEQRPGARGAGPSLLGQGNEDFGHFLLTWVARAAIVCLLKLMRRAMNHPLTKPDSARARAVSRDSALREGLTVTHCATAPFHLLEPRRLLQEEGVVNTLRILGNALRDREARQRAIGHAPDPAASRRQHRLRDDDRRKAALGRPMPLQSQMPRHSDEERGRKHRDTR
jgi:hypothetical protein